MTTAALECEHLARTSAYFDGELPEGTLAEAASHLATCTACQALLATAAGLDAVTTPARAPELAVPAAPARSRRPLVIGAAIAAVLAAAVVLFVVRPRGGPASPGSDGVIALGPARVVEARFSGAEFGKHRPYTVLRGTSADAAREQLPLALLAELEQRGNPRDLIAALVATGELQRAASLAAAQPSAPEADVDRAAVALAMRRPEEALEHAYRSLDARETPAARWNLALAARDLGLLHLARAQLARIAATSEPGWATEAAARVASLDEELAPLGRDYAAFEQRAKQMIEGGQALSAEDARRFPAYARINFYDAVRLAPDRARLDALRPLAAALDAASGSMGATAALERAAATDLPARARFAEAYRAVIQRRATPEDTAALLAKLDQAGPAGADLLVGVLVFSGQASPRAEQLAAIVAPWKDPWFDLAALRIQIATRFPGHDLRAEPALAQALDTCGDGVAMRCGQLAFALAQINSDSGRDAEAERYAAAALRSYRLAVAPSLVRAGLALVADQHRILGRSALARAELEDVVLTTTGSLDCDAQRNAQIGLVDLALAIGAWERVRTSLPPVENPAGCAASGSMYVATQAADLARHSGTPSDRAVAEGWLAAARASAEPTWRVLAAIGELRIASSAATRTEATTAVRAALAATVKDTATDGTLRGLHAWATGTLIDDAAASGDWQGAIRAALDEHPGATQAPCSLIASVDDDRVVVAAVHGTTAVGVRTTISPLELGAARIVSDQVSRALVGCETIAVVARPPLHGRPDLLPRELPWFFVGDSAKPPVAARPARLVEVVDAKPPAAVVGGALPAMHARVGFDVSLAGDAATPTATLAALTTATYAELHVHGVATATDDGAAFLALSPDAHGEFALRADAVRAAHFTGAPTIVLAACRASTVAPYLGRRWSLPDAFVAAGAGAVVAVDTPIDDATARTVFDELRRRVLGGEPVERVVAAIRATSSTPWVQRLMVFR